MLMKALTGKCFKRIHLPRAFLFFLISSFWKYVPLYKGEVSCWINELRKITEGSNLSKMPSLLAQNSFSRNEDAVSMLFNFLFSVFFEYSYFDNVRVFQCLGESSAGCALCIQLDCSLCLGWLLIMRTACPALYAGLLCMLLHLNVPLWCNFRNSGIIITSHSIMKQTVCSLLNFSGTLLIAKYFILKGKKSCHYFIAQFWKCHNFFHEAS